MVNRLTILSTDSMTYACPTVLPNVPNMKCEIKFGQIQKVAFQRQGQSFTREEITTKAGWSAFLTSQTDRNQMSFYFKANYSDHLALIQPEFNPMELMNINDVIGMARSPRRLTSHLTYNFYG